MSECFLCGRAVDDPRHGPNGHTAMVQRELWEEQDQARIARARSFADAHPIDLGHGAGRPPGTQPAIRVRQWRQNRRRYRKADSTQEVSA
jgi:hypothetical protein